MISFSSQKSHQRFWTLFALLIFASGLVIFLVTTMRNHLLFFVTPSDLVSDLVADLSSEESTKNRIRLGGFVLKGSLQKHVEDKEPLLIFTVTDGAQAIQVHHKGMVPDLFREGQGVIAEGRLEKGPGNLKIFRSTFLLAKHDETYIPKELKSMETNMKAQKP